MQTIKFSQPFLLAQTAASPTTSDSSDLNFDAAPSIELKPSTEEPAPNSHYIGLTSAISVIVSLLSLYLSWIIAKRLCRVSTHFLTQKLASAWHGLSLIVASFLGLNVFFGGLTAFLLNGNNEDAQVYFAEISALKLSRISHEHFFGYGILFGTITALGIFFVGPRKRILFPSALAFLFSALDAGSWWLSHYISFGFHTLSYLAGGIFAAGFLAMYLQIVQINLIGIFRTHPPSKTEDPL